MITYFQLEFLIFVIEAVLYATVLPIISEQKARKLPAVGYAFFANLMSFMTGMFVAFVLSLFFEIVR